ncbi:MAG: TlpA disulfide reductase family protein, partial [Daejeonella sp.]
FYTLVVGDKNFLVVAQNGDEVEFTTNYADTTNTYQVKGSDASEKIREFNKIGNDYGKLYHQIDEEYTALITTNPASKDSIYDSFMPKFEKNMEDYSNAALKFSENNKDNLAGFYAIGTIDQVKYEKPLIKYAEEIKNKYPKVKSVQAFVKRMEEVKPTSVGQLAPQFELPGTDGKMIKLSDFKGKYVLLDFWASWCGPCRKENPNVVKLYNRFKDKGFTVFGVSLDDNKSAWLEAIKADQLSWTHVSELKRWNGKVSAQYKVEGIPASFILDPTGKIIGKNLSGKKLEKFLATHLK